MNRVKGMFPTKPIFRALDIQISQDRYGFVIVRGVQIFRGPLDLPGKAVFGLHGMLSLSGVQSRSTGDRISAVFRTLKSEVTAVLVAHQLSTVREADQVIYLEEGKIFTTGTFEEISAAVPSFDRQASLMGL